MARLVWLITGCSSGFGEAFAYEILARGDKVIATARNGEARLSHLKEAGAAVIDLDVTATQDVINTKTQETIAIYGNIDVLVNNAGFSISSFIEETSTEVWMEILNTNFFGAANVTRALLPHFRSRKSGKIAFTNSIYSWMADPVVGLYAVSKHALSAYAAAFQKEVAQFGIQVVSFDIGHFRTEIISPEHMKIHLPAAEDYGPMMQGLIEASKGMYGFAPGDTKKGVQRMIDVLTQEGMAKGKEMPERLPLGPDALAVIRGECKKMLQVCDEWEELIISTDRDGPKEGMWADLSGGYAR